MVAIHNFFVFASLASALILPRDFPTVLADLKTIDADVDKLTAAVKAFTGPNNVGAVITAEGNVENDIKKATNDAKASAQATSAQATTVLNYFKNPLIPDIKAALNAVIAKKATFNSNGYGGIVRGDLNNLKSLSAGLGSALIAKTPQAQKASASAISSSVIALFNSAINAYGTS